MDWVRSVLDSSSGQRLSSVSTSNLPGHFPDSPSETTRHHNVMTTAGAYINYLLVRPATFLVYITLSVLARICQVIYFFERPNEGSSSTVGTTVSNALMNDPIARAEHFVRELEENLSPSQQFSSYHSDRNLEHLPPFFQGSYTQALYMASTRAKFLYVYLTNSISEGSQSLFTKVVTNPKFTEIFKENEHAIIWGGDVTNPEAYQLANSLNITKFPMLGLLCLTRTTSMTPEGPRKSVPRISLISKVQGGLNDSRDPDAVIQSKFKKRMVKYESDLVLIRSELREKYLSEAMRRQQDADYQRSLLRDKQRKEEKLNKKLSEKYLKWKQPYFKKLQSNKEVGNSSRIAIKFENGQRITVLFPKDSPVEDVFMFVELYTRDMLDDIYEATMSEADAQALFRDFTMKFDFRLTSSIPPRPTLNNIDMKTRIEDVSFIFPSGLLMVEQS
ncbi:hypothetical protein JCM33374_g691 [Metschnikowia sp. JCM 33374]|nr:hypothetical protein JCM33374_g691 [Metschnikowia sp. JCM 33374]